MTTLLALVLTAMTAHSAELSRQVFLIAGQSNSANHGNPRMTPTNPHVLNWSADTKSWRFAADPQSGATGDGGSPWPVFGSKLAQDLNADIGLVTVGVGGSAAAEWLPGTGAHFQRLKAAVRAFPKGTIRAVLWHQGEADVQRTTSAEEYAHILKTIMDALNAEAGYTIPWFVAEASYVNYDKVGDYELGRMAEIHRGQKLLWDSGAAFHGACTDDLVGPAWRWDGIHFNKKGLTEHGTRWATAVEATLYKDRLAL